MTGMRLTVSKHICKPPLFLRWRRNHRRARINKKWHKRYGAE